MPRPSLPAENIKASQEGYLDALRKKLQSFVVDEGYRWLFHTLPIHTLSPPKIKNLVMQEFGIPQSVFDKRADRWFYYSSSHGIWVAFKSDQDAIHYKLMGLGATEQWELPQ